MAEIDPALIVFLVILGAAAAVCIGYAIHRLAGIGASDSTDEQFNARSNAQDEYMREVRHANMKHLTHKARWHRTHMKAQRMLRPLTVA